MLTAFCVALALGLTAKPPITLDLEPTDNVWVYSHAPNTSGDPYLRIWGAEGKSVAPNGADVDAFSYSYLKWDLSSLPKDAKLVEAKLILTHIPNPGYPLDYANSSPLEVRALSGEFTERTWAFEEVATISPVAGKDGLYGSAAPDVLPGEGFDFKIVIDLNKADAFRRALTQSQGKAVAVALTTTMEPQAFGGKSIYKVYSRFGPRDKRPLLRLVFAG